MKFYSQNSNMLQKKFGTEPLAEKLEKSRRHSELTYEDKQIIEASEFFFLLPPPPTGDLTAPLKVATLASFKYLAIRRLDLETTTATGCSEV